MHSLIETISPVADRIDFDIQNSNYEITVQNKTRTTMARLFGTIEVAKFIVAALVVLIWWRAAKDTGG